MAFEEINAKLNLELKNRGLYLVWKPDQSKIEKPDNLIVFGAEQSPDTKEASISTDAQALDHQNRLLDALEAIGIPRGSLHSNFPRICRGKMWPTFIARITQESFRELSLGDGSLQG